MMEFCWTGIRKISVLKIEQVSWLDPDFAERTLDRSLFSSVSHSSTLWAAGCPCPPWPPGLDLKWTLERMPF